MNVSPGLKTPKFEDLSFQERIQSKTLFPYHLVRPFTVDSEGGIPSESNVKLTK